VSEYFQSRFGLTLDSVYWGEFHTHSSYSLDASSCKDGSATLSPGEAYDYARKTSGFDFVALSDHAEEPYEAALPADQADAGMTMWQSQGTIFPNYNDESPSSGQSPFIVFAAWEYTNTCGMQGISGSSVGFGHKNVLFREIDPSKLPAARSGASPLMKADYAESASDLWTRLEPWRPACPDCEGSALTIIHTPANVSKGQTHGDLDNHSNDWSVMNSEFARHVEVSSKWGASEGPVPAGQTCAADTPFEYTSKPSADPFTVRSVLYERWVKQGKKEYVLGFVGGTDGHKGMPGNDQFPQCGMEHRGAKTGIVASALTRDSLWKGLWNRHTMACTTGVEMPVLLAVETAGRDLLMGELGDHDGSVRVRVLARAPVQRLELVVDGCVVDTRQAMEFEAALTLPAGRHYLYARGTYEKDSQDTRMAWSSPVYLGQPVNP
jgi:hypothetical protein